MWYIIPQQRPGDRCCLLTGREYIVGRRDCDILVENDMSISRKHASLTVTHTESNVPQRLPVLTLVDTSKLGTEVQGERYIHNQCTISSGDVLIFGTAGVNKYTAIYEPYLVTTSCLDAQAKKSTKQLLCKMGGHVVNEWRKDCNALIMSSLSVTIKAICALVCQKPIVTPQYLEALIASHEAQSKQPSYDDYLPTLAESQLDPTQVSFAADSRRKALFQGKMFIFLSQKQFKKLNMAIELGGGTPYVMAGPAEDGDAQLVADGACVLSCDPTDQSQRLTEAAGEWITHAMRVLKRHKKRPIQECEIGYAVLYCSTEKHCNPDSTDAAPANIPVVDQTLSQMAADPSMSQQPAVTETQPTRTIRGSRKMKTDPDTAVAGGSKVKDEPGGQSGDDTEAATNGIHSRQPQRKRPRDDDEDGNTLHSNKAARTNTQLSTARIKQEVIPPMKEVRGHDSLKEEPTTRRVTRGARSPSPVAPPSDQAGQRAKRRRDQESSPSPPPRGRRASRSPSPRPEAEGVRPTTATAGRGRVRTKEKSPSPVAPPPSDQADQRVKRRRGQESSPSPPPRGSRATRSPSPKSEAEGVRPTTATAGRGRVRTKEKSPSPGPVSPVAGRRRTAKTNDTTPKIASGSETKRELSDGMDSDDGFDLDEFVSASQKNKASPKTVPTRANKNNRSPSAGPAEVKPDIDSAFDDLFSNPRRKEPVQKAPKLSANKQRQPSPVPVKEEVNSDNDDMDSFPRGGQTRRDPSPAPGRSTNVENQAKNRKDQSEVPRTALTPPDAVPGFLSTRRPLGDQVAADPEYVNEDQLPRSVILMEERALVVRRPDPQRAPKNTRTGDLSRWKGKLVKNFKRFNKVAASGANTLPHIIGGNDLVAHEKVARKETEEWFKDYSQAESQKNEMDKLAYQMFDFDASRKKTTKRR